MLSTWLFFCTFVFEVFLVVNSSNSISHVLRHNILRILSILPNPKISVDKFVYRKNLRRKTISEMSCNMRFYTKVFMCIHTNWLDTLMSISCCLLRHFHVHSLFVDKMELVHLVLCKLLYFSKIVHKWRSVIFFIFTLSVSISDTKINAAFINAS